jgi:hypothetical protein
LRTWALPAIAACAIVTTTALSRPDRDRCALADEAKAPGYVGADLCKHCHWKQFQSWKRTPMALALEHLKPGAAVDAKKRGGLDPAADYSTDSKCLRCHSTGHGSETGYPATNAGKAWTPDEEARARGLAGGSCEACHGAGSAYAAVMRANPDFLETEVVAAGLVQPVPAAQCTTCHVRECPTMPSDYVFDFERARKSGGVHAVIPLRRRHR